MTDDKAVSLKEVLAEIDAMPPVKAEGHDFIEKTCLKTRLELLSSAHPEPCATGYVGIEDDYPVSVKQVLNITAETGALTTQMRVRELPRYAQPVDKDINVPNTDAISRQAVRYKLTALVNEFEEILSHIREREVDDSVCGLCEYDGAYIGQSGDWCNECPGFEKDDCFKLKEKYRKEWTDLDG